MTKTNWKDILGWGEEQLNELRLSGFSFLREGKYDKALLFFKTLLIIDPESAYDAQTLGALYLQIGKKEEALLTLNRALAIDPTHEPSLLNKAKTLLLLEQRNEALEIAQNLQRSANPNIAGDAAALLAAYA